MKANPMKIQQVSPHSTAPNRRLLALAGLAMFTVLLAAPLAPGQNLIVDSFADAQSIAPGNTPGLDWDNFRGYTVTTSWDSTQASPGNPNSGAMYVTVDWPGPSDPGYTTAWTDMQFGFSTGGSFISS